MIPAIAILALALRFAAMRAQGSAWFDEAFSLHFASKPLAELSGFLLLDVHPPLYLPLLHAWSALFGETLVSARSLSVLAGAVAAVLIGRGAARVFGPEAGALAAFAAAVSPILVFHSAEARMYALLTLLVAASTERFLAWLDSERKDGKAFAAWAAFSGLAMLTHLTAVLPFAVAAGFAFAGTGGKARRRAAAVASASILPFLLWAAAFFAGRASRIGGEWQLTGDNPEGTVLGRFVDLFAFSSPAWARGVFAALLLVAVAAALLEWKRRPGENALEVRPRSDVRLVYLAASAALPFLVFMPVHLGTVKYLFVAFPAAAALAAGGAIRLFGAKRTPIVMVVLAALVLQPLLLLVTEKRIRWDEAAAFIEARERAGDAIWNSWYVNELPLRRHYDGALPMSGAYPYDPSLSFDERLVRHAGQIMVDDGVLVDLETFVADADRAFLVTGGTSPARQPSFRWFFERGWKLVETHETNAFSPVVHLLERPN